MLKIKKYVRIVHVGEGSEEESEIVLEMARRCKPFLECISVTYSLNHPEKGKNVKYVSKLNFFCNLLTDDTVLLLLASVVLLGSSALLLTALLS